MLDSKLIELDTRLLVAFRAVAEELHFGRAASRLFISQPPLSLQIKRLEGLVGVQLFARTTRSVALTPAGRIFQTHLERILADIDLMLKETQRAADGNVGVLTIGLTPAACASPVVSLLHDYRTEHPDISLELIEVSSLETAAKLRRGVIDIGVMRPGPPQADIMRVATFNEELCLAVRCEHPLADKKSIKATDLASVPLIDYDPVDAPYLYKQVRHAYAHYGIVPNVVQQSRMPTILTLVEAGSGLALVPRSAIRTTVLRAVPLQQNSAAQASLEIVMEESNKANTIIKNFIDWLGTQIGELTTHGE